MKIRKKIEKLNSKLTKTVASNRENSSYQDRNKRMSKLNIKIFSVKLT